MNKLETYIKDKGLNECSVMNALQSRGGIISDCCVWAADVASVNEDDAITFLGSAQVRGEIKRGYYGGIE